MRGRGARGRAVARSTRGAREWKPGTHRRWRAVLADPARAPCRTHGSPWVPAVWCSSLLPAFHPPGAARRRGDAHGCRSPRAAAAALACPPAAMPWGPPATRGSWQRAPRGRDESQATASVGASSLENETPLPRPFAGTARRVPVPRHGVCMTVQRVAGVPLCEDHTSVEHPHLFEISAWPWLERLSAREHRRVTLADVPGAEWDVIAARGFTHVFLMGVWRRSPLGRAIALDHAGLRAEYGDA